jgi:hypothetical protein
MTYLLGMEDEPIGKDDNAIINFQVNKVGGKPVNPKFLHREFYHNNE